MALYVDVHVPSDPISPRGAERLNGDTSAPTSPSSTAAAALRQRWRKHCEGARVDIRVSEDAGTSTKDKAPRTTLLHQDARLELLQDGNDGGVPSLAPETEQKSELPHAATLVFRCEVFLKVRSEYWNRPLQLGLRITPHSAGSGISALGEEPSGALPSLSESLSSTFFTEQLQNDHVLRLIREETMASEPLTRTIERQICVMKPLQLKMETRYLSKERVCIIAKATNAHPHLELKVLDLHLHLNESYANPATSSVSASNNTNAMKTRSERSNPPGNYSAAGATGGKPMKMRRPQRHFRIVNEAHEQFPICIRSNEQHNFLFILEAIETRNSWDDDDEDESAHGNENEGKSAPERAGSMNRSRSSTGNAIKRHSVGSVSGVSVASSSSGRTVKSAPQTQQTLLTLSWEASGSLTQQQNQQARSFNSTRLSAPITEYHTIIWSPQNLSASSPMDAATTTAALSPLSASTLASLGIDGGSVNVVRLGKQCVLSMSVAPLAAPIAVGEMVTICLVIANRSQHTSFDLTLLAPFAQHSAVNPPPTAAQKQRRHQHRASPAWLSFEASHRLG